MENPTPTIPDDIQARVDLGAAWFDQHLAEWPTMIDLYRLDAGSECDDVVGQIVRHHIGASVSDDDELEDAGEHDGRSAFGMWEDRTVDLLPLLTKGSQKVHGLVAIATWTAEDPRAQAHEYEHLTAAWRQAIADRLGA